MQGIKHVNWQSNFDVPDEYLFIPTLVHLGWAFDKISFNALHPTQLLPLRLNIGKQFSLAVFLLMILKPYFVIPVHS